MHICSLVVTILALVLALGSPTRGQGVNDEGLTMPRIVNGQAVTSQADAPYQVRLEITLDTGSALCGGAVLDASWVVTAAHCVANAAATSISVTVYAGTLARDGTGGVSRAVDNFYVYPTYTGQDDDEEGSDIALLHLSSPFTLTTVTIERNPNASNAPAGGTSVRITGWGNTDAVAVGNTRATLPDTLQQGSTTVQDQATASAWLIATGMSSVRPCTSVQQFEHLYNWDNLVATGSAADPDQGFCSGDSGGPVTVVDSSSPVGRSLVSVISHGWSCGVARVPQFSTSTVAKSSWVSSTIASPPTLCGTRKLTCGPGADCVSGACTCKAGYSAFLGNTDPYGWTCNLWLYSGQATTFTYTGVYLLVPTATQWNASIVRGWDLTSSQTYPKTDYQCGYAWLAAQGTAGISQTLAQVTSTASAAGLGTPPTTIWTGMARTATDTSKWFRSIDPATNSMEVDLTGLWGTGAPGNSTIDSAVAASFSTSLLDTQNTTTETWAVVFYPTVSSGLVPGFVSPSPSPVASPAVLIKSSLWLWLLLLLPVVYAVLLA